MHKAVLRGTVFGALILAAIAALGAAVSDVPWFDWICLTVIWVCLAWVAYCWAQDALSYQAAEPAASCAKREEARARFVSSVGHDLRQPLQAISLFAASLTAQPLPSGARQIARNLETSVESLSGLFEEVIALARLDVGREKFDLQPVALAGPISEAVVRHLSAAHARGVHLRKVATSLQVMADETQLARALDRLVAHAVRTTAKGGIVIGCRRHDDNVVVQVWDSGEGIPLLLAADIFEPFCVYGRRHPDRALGLALAHRIAQQSGGHLDLHSWPGKGSVFSLSLPRVVKAS